MKTIILKFLISGSGIILSAIFGLVLLKILSIKYGPELIGEFGIFRQFFQFLSVVITLGKGHALIHGLSASKNKDKYLKMTFKYYLLFLTLLSLILVILNKPINFLIFNQTNNNLMVSLPITLFFSSLFYFNAHFLAAKKHIATSSLLQTLPFLFMIFSALATNQIDYIFLISYAAAWIISIFISNINVLKIIPSPKDLILRNKPFEKVFISTIFNSLISLLSILTFKILIQKYNGIANVGYFEAAWNIALYSNMIIYSGLNFYLLPKISNGSIDNKILKNIKLFILTYTLVASSTQLIAAKELINILYSDKFSKSVEILKVLVLSEMFRGFNFYFYFSFLGSSNKKTYLKVEIISNTIFIISLLISVVFFNKVSIYTLVFFNFFYFIFSNYLIPPLYKVSRLTSLFLISIFSIAFAWINN